MEIGLEYFVEMIYLIVRDFGYLGVFIGMAIESSFFPFPSEIIMIPAGALIANGEMSFLLVFLAGTFGCLVGASINYFLALVIGRSVVEGFILRYKRNFFLSHVKLKRSDDYFERYGSVTTFIGRLIPGVRQVISIPAGFARMNFLRFSVFTFLGAGLWNLVLIMVGYFSGNNVEWFIENMEIINLVVLVCLFVLVIGYFVRKIYLLRH